MQEVYHVKHTCGHSVYWESPYAAVTANQFPCPWCGGETGTAKPKLSIVDYGALIGRVYPRPDVRGDDEAPPVLIHHRVDESCCTGTPPLLRG